MKVLMMMQSFENGGVQRVMINLINGFIDKKVNVVVLVMDGNGEMKANLNDKCEIIDLKKKHLPGDFKFLFSTLAIKNVIKKQKPDVVVACPGFASVSLAIANKLSKVKTKTIAIIDNRLSILNDTIKHKITLRLYKRYLKYIDLIVAAHDSARKDIIKTLKMADDKVVRVYHPLISEELLKEHVIKHKWFDKNNKVLLSVGRLVKEKNYNGLIDAFNLLLLEHPELDNLKLIIVGDGPEKEMLKQKIKDYKLEDKIDLYGYSDKPYDFMRKASVYVSSSSKEAFGNVIVEALACGMPVVATDCVSGGPREILDNGKYGILCKLDDVFDLKDSIYKCLNNSVNKENNIKRGFTFSINNSVKEYLKVIQKVGE